LSEQAFTGTRMVRVPTVPEGRLRGFLRSQIGFVVASVHRHAHGARTYRDGVSG